MKYLIICLFTVTTVFAQKEIDCEGFSKIIDDKYIITNLSGGTFDVGPLGVIDMKGNQLMGNVIKHQDMMGVSRIIFEDVIMGRDENKDEVLIPIYIQIDDILGKEKWDISYRGLKGKDINRAIKDLLKSASKLIPTNTGFQEEMRKNNIDVKIMRYAPTETNVIVSNRIKRQTDGDAYFRFDFNFLLSYDSGAKKILKILAGQLNAKKYTNVEVDLYGAAYRNGVIKGKRITGSD